VYSLTHLIKTNDPAGLKFFLDLGADVEARLPAFDMTHLDADEVGVELEPLPLLIVADLDNVPLARLLLDKGAKVQYFNQYDNGIFSPIHAARSAEMVKLLLDHNADTEFDDDMGRRPLHWYAIRNDIEAMLAILQHGANANPTGPFLEEPLHEAAQRNLDTVELLMEYGAHVEVRDHNVGNMPLHLAAVNGKTAVVKFLVERWPEGMRETNEDQETPLHLAMR
jgi:ankyrin repeat protein